LAGGAAYGDMPLTEAEALRANYGRILLRCWKNSLIREMTFRGHFVLNVLSEIGWIVLLLIFIKIIFNNTSDVRGWNEAQYLFLMGTHMIVTSLFETLFFGNCWQVGQLVRTGDLDFVLLRPANAQFLLSFARVDFSALANTPVGIGICLYALSDLSVTITPGKILLFILLIAGGVLILYSLLFSFAITSIWLIRQTGIDHLWFYAVNLVRYPAEIYKPFAGGLLWFALVFVIPLLMVANLPANVMVRTFAPGMVIYVLFAGLVLLALSALTFRMALKWYRSASS
jgi:ABC-2 type transport system permease protein